MEDQRKRAGGQGLGGPQAGGQEADITSNPGGLNMNWESEGSRVRGVPAGELEAGELSGNATAGVLRLDELEPEGCFWGQREIAVWLWGEPEEIPPELLMDDWEDDESDCSTTQSIIEQPVLKRGSQLASEVGLSLLELTAKNVVNANHSRAGRPAALSNEEQERLCAYVKRDFGTRRLRLVDIKREAGFGTISDATVYKVRTSLLQRYCFS